MSSDADVAATVALYDSFYTESYCTVAASVLFVYDALITFDQEVACFWTARRTGASLLFFPNKWISMTYYVMMAATIFASFPSDKLSSRGALKGIQQSKRLSLSDILFRDGTIYFIVLFILNALHLTISLAGSDGGSNVTIFTGPFTAILVSRFLLKLQEAERRVCGLDFDDSSRNPHETSSFISSLGGFINPDLSTPSDDGSELQDSSRSEDREED
ncbi:hypothetical protein C8T65DRAFT_744136 [Cerioporus squamosus]|nr:hypothetical protein C8T65DRAFT_744136 [Cerioporus squamosus]